MQTEILFRITDTKGSDIYVNPTHITTVRSKTSITNAKTTIVDYYTLPEHGSSAKTAKIKTNEPLETLVARLDNYRNPSVNP